MSTRPPVTQLVLYKHGVAFVGRRGPVDGDFELTFRRDDMKDVLKSLFIAGGQVSVGAVSFDTPADPRAELADRNLLLAPGQALTGLLEGLRGRAVEVHCGKAQHRGQVIGVDSYGQSPARRLLVLRDESGALSLVDLAEATGLALLEDPSAQDLEYLVDRSRAATAGPNCDVTVRIRGRADELQVSYIVPAPVWRVSYRLVRDGDTLTVAAMGIIHNPVDEDLADVELTLTTGQPISFDIDLYHGKYVQRTVVEEAERVAAPARLQARTARDMVMGAPPTGAAYADAAADVETGDRGEYFEYRLASPVSLKRGGAAMVPLVIAEIDEVRRELVWGSAFEVTAPDVVLAFTNTTGVVLEEGPAVIYERDGYAGEAMLGFTARGAKMRCSFAKDLAVRCAHDSTVETVTTGIRLATEAVIEEQRRVQRHVLHAENDHDEPVEVVFELPYYPGHTFTEHTDATEVTEDQTCRRFRVAVPAHQKVDASVLETWQVHSRIDYEQLSPGQLEQWLAGRALDAATIEVLSGVLAQWERAHRLDAQREPLQAERAEVYEAQSRIAEQLRVLGTDGAEGELRGRYVAELDGRQNRVDDLDAQIRGLRDDAEAARQAAAAELQRIIGAAG